MDDDLDDDKLTPRPGVDFELEHIKGLDVPAARKPVSGRIDVIHTKRIGDTVVCSGFDPEGLFCWVVTRIGGHRAQWAVAYDEREALEYVEEFERV